MKLALKCCSRKGIEAQCRVVLNFSFAENASANAKCEFFAARLSALNEMAQMRFNVFHSPSQSRRSVAVWNWPPLSRMRHAFCCFVAMIRPRLQVLWCCVLRMQIMESLPTHGQGTGSEDPGDSGALCGVGYHRRIENKCHSSIDTANDRCKFIQIF